MDDVSESLAWFGMDDMPTRFPSQVGGIANFEFSGGVVGTPDINTLEGYDDFDDGDWGGGGADGGGGGGGYGVDAGKGGVVLEPKAERELGRPRGLVVRSLTLKQVEVGWFKSLFQNDPKELYIISIGVDLSGDKPFVWPQSMEDAALGTLKMRPGDRHEFTFGLGYPVFLPRPIVGGLALSILVASSKADERDRWKHLSEATDALNGDATITGLLQSAAVDPIGATITAVGRAVSASIGLIGKVLAQTGDITVGSFRGIFPATSSWGGLLSDDQPDVAIELAEVTL